MQIKKAYEIWSSIYDSNENKTRDLDVISTIETLSNYSFSNVIELGCGTGKNTKWLIEHANKIIGLDFSESMLAIAKEKLNSNKVEFQIADLNETWIIKNKSADLITCSLTLEHIEDLNHIFKEAQHALASKGIFFISELHPFKQYAGSKARFTDDSGTTVLNTFTHHISDYLDAASNNNFQMLEIKEWFDEEKTNEKLPRLISFVFRKED